jgi:trk system potassium uptake protein TrkA
VYLIVVGAGAVSSFFIRFAQEEGHDVALIERDEQAAQQIVEQYDIAVFHADLVQDSVLDEAGASHADALVATTDDDALNLMAIFMGAEYEIPTLISTVTRRAHQRMFERLGAHVLVDPEAIIARHLYKLMITPRLQDRITLPGGEYLFETTLQDHSPLVGRTLADAREQDMLATDILIASIKREDERIIGPAEHVTLEAGDHLLVFAHRTLSEDEYQPFTG